MRGSRTQKLPGPASKGHIQAKWFRRKLIQHHTASLQDERY